MGLPSSGLSVIFIKSPDHLNEFHLKECIFKTLIDDEKKSRMW